MATPLGPLLAGTGASGVVAHRGWALAEWGDPTAEMTFGVTKTFPVTAGRGRGETPG